MRNRRTKGLYGPSAHFRGAGMAWPALRDALHAESGRWFLWVPVCFGTGVGIYFSLSHEPSSFVAVALVMAASGLCLATRSRALAWIFSIGLLCVACGFSDAMLRTHMVSASGLQGRDRAVTLTAWVEVIENRENGARLTLRPISVSRLDREDWPYRVRVTSRFDSVPYTGQAISVRALLRPVPEPAMPHGFDFARKAYFDRIGAVGFTLSEPEAIPPPQEAPVILRVKAAIDTVRRGIEARITAALPEQGAAIAVALITGDRGRIPEETLQALRNSGLAHLLAISGMHMALMAGALYWVIRAGAAAFPGFALQHPVKKYAAVAAIFGGAFYLVISGGSVATQRAFLMMTIMFVAILLDRPALTLRNVALAALLILVLFPESLLDVSFQMSFAAVTALVAVYERVDRRRTFTAGQSFLWRAAKRAFTYIAGIALTTLVASIAIAPFAAFHFHKLAQYSLLANLAAMPSFGLLVMPMALLSLVTMPFGLEQWPLHLMAYGVKEITDVAQTVSAWEGASIPVARMPVASLMALAAGGLWLTLWRTRWRYLGLPIALVGALVAGAQPKPDLLVGRDGQLLAMRTANDALSVAGTNRPNYSIERWLIADGDPRDPVEALKSQGFACDELACVGETRGKTVALVMHHAALAEECSRADIVISRVPMNRKCPGARVHLDLFDMKREGAYALYLDGQSIRVQSVAAARGNRPWAPAEARTEKSPPGGRAFADEGTQ